MWPSRIMNLYQDWIAFCVKLERIVRVSHQSWGNQRDNIARSLNLYGYLIEKKIVGYIAVTRGTKDISRGLLLLKKILAERRHCTAQGMSRQKYMIKFHSFNLVLYPLCYADCFLCKPSMDPTASPAHDPAHEWGRRIEASSDRSVKLAD